MARNALQVTINGKEFVSKEAKKAETSLTGLQKVGGIVNKALVASFAAAAAGIAASVAAMARAVSSTEKFADNIDKMSQKIGISREAFQEWDFILSQNGMNIDSLQTSIKTLANAAEEASRGTITYTRTFDALGISIYDTSGALKDQEDLLFDSISALSDMENTTLRTAYASDLFGRSATELAPLLNSGADSVENLRQKAHELGLVISDETIDAGVSLHDTMDQLRRTFQAVIAKAVTPLMGELNNLGQTFLDQVQEGGGLQRFLSTIVRMAAWIINTGVPIISGSFDIIGNVIAVTAEEIKDQLSGVWDSLDDIPILSDIKIGIQAFIEMTGDLFDALKAGDWKTFWNLAAPVLGGAVTLLAMVKVAGNIGSAIWTSLQGLFGGAGFLISGVKGLGVSGVMAGLSIAVAIKEAIDAPDGGWSTFAANIGIAIASGFAAGVLTGNPSVGFMVFTIALNFKLADKAGEALSKLIRDVTPGLELFEYQGNDEELQKIQSILNRVETMFSGAKDKLKDIWSIDTGRQILAGLGVGLADIEVMGAQMARDFLFSVQDELEIKSPSRKAYWWGEMIKAGLADSLKEPAYWDMIQYIVSTGVANIQDAMKDIEVVDPEAIISGITGNGEKSTQDSGGGYSLQRFGNAQPKVWDPSGGGLGDTLMSLFTRFGDLVKVMDTFQQVIDPVGTIFAGMMEVLGPAIDSILKPIVNVLKILGGTIGQILLPVFEAVGAVVEKLGEAFVWLYNKVIKPVGNFLIEAFNSIANGILRAVNGVISAINWAFGWLGVDIQKLALRDADQGKLADISMSQVMAGASSSVYSGSAPGSSTSVQQLNINVYQYFQGNVIGDGGMESVGEFTIRALQAYSGAGGNVQVVSA